MISFRLADVTRTMLIDIYWNEERILFPTNNKNIRQNLREERKLLLLFPIGFLNPRREVYS